MKGREHADRAQVEMYRRIEGDQVQGKGLKQEQQGEKHNLPHPMVVRYIEEFEREARARGLYRKQIGTVERLFLDQVWGPVLHYNFSGLKAEYPMKDFRGGQRFADFVFVREGMRLLIELDGFTTHARDLSPREFDDHLFRQNHMVLSGWIVLRFSFRQVEQEPEQCQGQLKQALGHWWSLTQGTSSARAGEGWTKRREMTVQLALRLGGRVRPIELSEAFSISSRTASVWLRRFTEEGVFEMPRKGLRTRSYRLVQDG